MSGERSSKEHNAAGKVAKNVFGIMPIAYMFQWLHVKAGQPILYGCELVYGV